MKPMAWAASVSTVTNRESSLKVLSARSSRNSLSSLSTRSAPAPELGRPERPNRGERTQESTDPINVTKKSKGPHRSKKKPNQPTERILRKISIQKTIKKVLSMMARVSGWPLNSRVSSMSTPMKAAFRSTASPKTVCPCVVWTQSGESTLPVLCRSMCSCNWRNWFEVLDDWVSTSFLVMDFPARVDGCAFSAIFSAFPAATTSC
mmetsp:Transcript_58351/g.189012  ORF Transcript_58351/g.189012 Transcript_58351/m.189012 type:complete len:206 (+) Transcript_58351:181-798(+)